MILPEAEPAACRVFFGDTPRTAARLPTSGFSGSDVVLVECLGERLGGDRARWVVKSFGTGVSAARAAWVHGLMGHLHEHGIGSVPTIHRVRMGVELSDARAVTPTLVEDGKGVLWEAVQFLPGRPADVPDAPARAEAMRLLARIHLAAATLPGAVPRTAASRGLVERVERAALLQSSPWRGRWHGVDRDEASAQYGAQYIAVRDLLKRAIEAFEQDGAAAIGRVARRRPVECRCQAVLRDIWSEHVLFEGGQIKGIIDFHAAGIDTVATDLARLVGSWRLAAAASPAPVLAPSWEECLAAYETVRPLHHEERSLVTFFHHAGLIVAIDNWFRWLVEEQRTFADIDAVNRRLGQLVAALPDSIAALLI